MMIIDRHLKGIENMHLEFGVDIGCILSSGYFLCVTSSPPTLTPPHSCLCGIEQMVVFVFIYQFVVEAKITTYSVCSFKRRHLMS